MTENLAIKRSFSHNLVPVRTIRKCVIKSKRLDSRIVLKGSLNGATFRYRSQQHLSRI